MTPREIILSNINHDNPERPGLTFDNGRIQDMLFAQFGSPQGYKKKRWTEDNFEYYDDEWGNTWRRIVGGCARGEIFKPAMGDWSQLDNLRIPRYDAPDCSSEMKIMFAKSTDKFRLACINGWIFNDARYIRKMDIYFMDMIMFPNKVKHLHKIIATVYESKILSAAQSGADGIVIGEDMGTQTGLLFSPEMWRNYFQDEYKRLFGIAHECGMKVFMHSCGRNWDIIPDLLKAGVDCFQFDQPTLYDMPKLAAILEKYKAALWSPVDIQKIMPTGDKNIIEASAREMVEIFRGGLICKDYPDRPGIGVKEEWDMWAYNAILEESGVIPKPIIDRVVIPN